MKQNELSRSFLAAALVIATASIGFSQSARQDLSHEKNVRAEMGFLASDAMQGRGSGTIFERVAAEYIGSQFMQFGLEPAGENGPDGKPTFVQSVDISRQSFAEAPWLKYYDKTIVHGKEMIVLSTTSASVTGGLQSVGTGETPRADAAVILRAKEGEDMRAMMGAARKLVTAGASIVLIEETPEIRANWANFASRMPSFTTSNAKPSLIAVVSKAVADELAGEADGLVIKFEGKLEPGQKTADLERDGQDHRQ